MTIEERISGTADPIERHRVITALHEATHVVFAVVLGGEVHQEIGIPKLDGSNPRNVLGRARGFAGYVSATHFTPDNEGVICLGGWAFEKRFGDADTALWDYEDALSRFTIQEMPEMELLAFRMLNKLEPNIVACADDILIKATKQGVVCRSKAMNVVAMVKTGLSDDLRRLGGRTEEYLSKRFERKFNESLSV